MTRVVGVITAVRTLTRSSRSGTRRRRPIRGAAAPARVVGPRTRASRRRSSRRRTSCSSGSTSCWRTRAAWGPRHALHPGDTPPTSSARSSSTSPAASPPSRRMGVLQRQGAAGEAALRGRPERARVPRRALPLPLRRLASAMISAQLRSGSRAQLRGLGQPPDRHRDGPAAPPRAQPRRLRPSTASATHGPGRPRAHQDPRPQPARRAISKHEPGSGASEHGRRRGSSGWCAASSRRSTPRSGSGPSPRRASRPRRASPRRDPEQVPAPPIRVKSTGRGQGHRDGRRGQGQSGGQGMRRTVDARGLRRRRVRVRRRRGPQSRYRSLPARGGVRHRAAPRRRRLHPDPRRRGGERQAPVAQFDGTRIKKMDPLRQGGVQAVRARDWSATSTTCPRAITWSSEANQVNVARKWGLGPDYQQLGLGSKRQLVVGPGKAVAEEVAPIKSSRPRPRATTTSLPSTPRCAPEAGRLAVQEATRPGAVAGAHAQERGPAPAARRHRGATRLHRPRPLAGWRARGPPLAGAP